MSRDRVDFDSVSYRYPDGTEALRSVRFSVEHGESVGLVGANGSGKSTLLAQLNGLLLPTQGQVRIGGVPVKTATLPQVRRTMGLVLQNPDDQLFMPTVLEDVAFGPLNLGLEPSAAEERALKALESVGAADLLSRAPHRLSLGQRSSVAIAAVLAMDPDILAMDEPAARLDPRARRGLISLLKGFRRTKLVASHDLDLVLELCGRVLVLQEGRLVADGPAARVLGDEALLQSHGLELPPGRRGLGSPKDSPEDRDVPTFVWNRN